MPNSSGQSTKFVSNSANCFTCQWRERSQWSTLNQDDLNVLNGHRKDADVKPGQILFRQGDPCDGVYCVASGTIAIRKMDEHGNSVLVRLRHAGQTIGYRDFFGGPSMTNSAEALVESRVCFVDRKAVAALLERNPALGLQFLQRIAKDLQDAEETILQTTTLPIRTRLAHLLLTLKERYGRVDETGTITIQLPLARQDIAAILGTRPETIARTIRGLDNEGVARFSGRTVVVENLDRLLDEIETDHMA